MWDTANLHLTWQVPFVWKQGHINVSLNFSRDSLHFPWNFSHFSPTIILNSGTWSLVSTRPNLFLLLSFLLFSLPDLHLLPSFLLLFPPGLVASDNFVSPPAEILLPSTREKHAGRDWTLNLCRRTSLCKSLKSTRRLLTSSLSKDFLQSWRKRWNWESTTFSNFPGCWRKRYQPAPPRGAVPWRPC